MDNKPNSIEIMACSHTFSIFAQYHIPLQTKMIIVCIPYTESDGDEDGEGEGRRSRKRKSSEGRGISPIQWDRQSEEEEEEEEKSDEEGSDAGSNKSGNAEEDEAKGEDKKLCVGQLDFI